MLDSVFQIDDVNLVPRAENVWLHLWVPVAALVSEMYPARSISFILTVMLIPFLLG